MVLSIRQLATWPTIVSVPDQWLENTPGVHARMCKIPRRMEGKGPAAWPSPLGIDFSLCCAHALERKKKINK